MGKETPCLQGRLLAPQGIHIYMTPPSVSKPLDDLVGLGGGGGGGGFATVGGIGRPRGRHPQNSAGFSFEFIGGGVLDLLSPV